MQRKTRFYTKFLNSSKNQKIIKNNLQFLLRKNNYQPRILDPAKLYNKCEDRRKTFFGGMRSQKITAFVLFLSKPLKDMFLKDEYKPKRGQHVTQQKGTIIQKSKKISMMYKGNFMMNLQTGSLENNQFRLVRDYKGI